ncbi:MAG: hypothetical protein JSR46_03285 [Verrucomicrobia bacterium]|nr:hypothetical protein [Verrucomicrobiota bacterium]
MLQQHHSKKVRLSVDCSAEERRYIKMLAAREDKTISEYLMGLAREQMPMCTLNHTPNAETIRSIEESEQGIGIERFESLDDFWKSMGE